MSPQMSEYEDVAMEPRPNGAHAEHTPPVSIRAPVAAPPPAGPRLLRREVWVDIAPEEYPGFRAKLWVNYPRRLLDDVNQPEDADLRKRALCQMVVATNDWCDYDGQPFPPASEPAFWDAIPDELAAALIALVNREAGKLAWGLATQKRTR